MDKHTRRSVQPRILETEPVKKFDGIAGAGVIILARDTGRCLFQLRNSDKRHKNTWGF